MHESVALSPGACEALLRSGDFGRVALLAADGPHIVPVNYLVAGSAVVVRTSPSSELATLGPGSRLAFEVDHVENDHDRGWSVVVRGPVERVDDPTAVRRLEAGWPAGPWHPGQARVLLRLRWDAISGRQRGSGWDPLAQLGRRTTSPR
jgi:hypothetical protein